MWSETWAKVPKPIIKYIDLFSPLEPINWDLLLQIENEMTLIRPKNAIMGLKLQVLQVERVKIHWILGFGTFDHKLAILTMFLTKVHHDFFPTGS